ncbi:MAG: cupin domain-containing protein [Candidatus Tyrphobacter sp.]
MRRSSKRQAPAPVPDVGKILKSLRARHRVTVREVAARSGLSPSFISAVERGESDISLRRLARLAQFFEHDIGAFLGFSAQLSRPNFVRKESRSSVKRGRGVDYQALHLPGIDLDLIIVRLAPSAAFQKPLTHEGIDVVYVLEGTIVLDVAGEEYPMAADDCCVYSAGYPHGVRNGPAAPARIVALTTARMY